jgi:AcrR family transcriptional regulator
VPRTVDPTAHRLRRETFVDAAQQLITERGYDQLSITDVLSATGASRGALYHYFGSKGDLLEAVVDRMVRTVLTQLEPMVDDPSLPAEEKLARLFAGIGHWKTERKDLLLALLSTWYSDENIVVRDKFRHDVVRRLTPIFARIVEQGNAEGSFRAGSPMHSAEVLIALLLGLNERAGRLYLDFHAHRISRDDVETSIAAYVDAFERILGVSPGTLVMVDQPTLDAWFEREPLERSIAS